MIKFVVYFVYFAYTWHGLPYLYITQIRLRKPNSQMNYSVLLQMAAPTLNYNYCF